MNMRSSTTAVSGHDEPERSHQAGPAAAWWVRCVLACLGLAALAVQPLAAHAANLTPMITPAGPVQHEITMYESRRVFPSGTKVPGSVATISAMVPGSMATL